MSSARKIAVIALFSMASCAAPRVAQDYQRDTAYVTIREEVVFKDSIVFVPLPDGEASAILPDSDTSRLETILAVSTAFVAEGELHHTLKNKDALLPVEIKFPKYVYTENDYIVRERKITEQIEVEKQMSRWQRFIQALGYGLLLYCIIWLAVKLARFV